jgi:branched-subunit amino acid transport protein AzlD
MVSARYAGVRHTWAVVEAIAKYVPSSNRAVLSLSTLNDVDWQIEPEGAPPLVTFPGSLSA